MAGQCNCVTICWTRWAATLGALGLLWSTKCAERTAARARSRMRAARTEATGPRVGSLACAHEANLSRLTVVVEVQAFITSCPLAGLPSLACLATLLEVLVW
jgi:hypothetical protein